MAEGHINTNRLPIQCPVCLETYHHPRTLPCLHTFCTTCLHGHIVHSEFAISFSTFPCPVCRVSTKPPKPFARRETWAEQFPVNYWIQSVIEETETITAPDEPCCQLHRDCKVNLYCSDHREACCATCVAVAHRQCVHVDEISKLVEGWDKDTAINDLLLKTKQTEDIMIDLDARCVLAGSDLNINKDKIASKIELKHEAVVSHLNKLKDNALKDLENIYKPNEDEIEDKKKVCEKDKVRCQEVRSIIDKLDKTQSPSKAFIECQKARNKLDEIDVFGLNQWKVPEANGVEFLTNPAIDTILQISNLGTVQIVDKTKNEHETAVSSRNEENFEGSKTDKDKDHVTDKSVEPVVLVRNVREQRTLRPESKSSSQLHSWTHNHISNIWNNDLFRKSWISGSVFLNHGVLILCNQSRSSLCLVRESRFLCEEKRRTPPWCATKVTDSKIAVTYPQENCIRLFDIKSSGPMLKLFRRPSLLGRPVILQRNFNTEDPCFGIATTGDRLFTACEDNIRVFSLSGMCCQVLKLSLRSEPLFKRVIGLAVDTFHSVLYAVDEMCHAVLAFNVIEQQLMHHPVFVYRHQLLRCPQNVAVGANSEVYVSGFVSKTVHVLNRQGDCTRIFSMDGRPSCLTVDPKRQLILTGYYPETDDVTKSDHVRIYKLHH